MSVSCVKTETRHKIYYVLVVFVYLKVQTEYKILVSSCHAYKIVRSNYYA